MACGRHAPGLKRVTVSAVLPLLSHIKENFMAHREGDTDLTDEMKSKIMDNLDSHYNKQTIVNGKTFAGLNFCGF